MGEIDRSRRSSDWYISRLVLLGIDAATIIAKGDSAIALLFGLLAKYTPSFIETSSIVIITKEEATAT
jgi:hypothetical protein